MFHIISSVRKFCMVLFFHLSCIMPIILVYSAFLLQFIITFQESKGKVPLSLIIYHEQKKAITKDTPNLELYCKGFSLEK